MSDEEAVRFDAPVVLTPQDEERQARYQLPADIVVLVVFVIAYVASRDLFETAAWFPTALCVGGLLVGGIKFALDLRRWLAIRSWLKAGSDSELPAELRERRELSEEMVVLTSEEKRELLAWVAYIATLLLLIGLVGLIPASAVWLPVTLVRRAKVSRLAAGISTAALVATLLLLEEEVGIHWPYAIFDILEFLR